MRSYPFLSLMVFAIISFLIGCNPTDEMNHRVSSPSNALQINVGLTNDSQPYYQVIFKDQTIIDTSLMGFEFQNQAPMEKGFSILSSEIEEVDEKWEMPWGEQREVVNHYNELTLELEETESPHRALEITFRAYDDGIGFRYHFPEQEGVDSLVIMNEHSHFQLTGDHTCWWIPGDWDIYEHLYNTTSFSEIDAIAKRDHPNLAQSYIPVNAVNTPVTMRTREGIHLSFHEAALTDYADMTLEIDPENLHMKSGLVGSDRLGYKVKRALPFSTPWRTIQVAEKATDLITSKLIVNLNEPNQLGDISWFQPMKYIGIWWEMHLDKSTWDMASGRHGATTENTQKYIDFAAENNIKGVLVEGWNTGWENWLDPGSREGVFDFVTPYPDYDLAGLVQYAKDKGVEIIIHHETSAAPRTYAQQMEKAYALMKNLGIHSVKTGYVGKIIPEGEYHHGQWMVQHYRQALETAVKYQVAINAHEPIKATGIRRTFPNAISREGLRGQEFNAWSVEGGNPPEHLPIVAFTRMLAGPIDFTPGVFQIKLDRTYTDPTTHEENPSQINTTLAQQLALYVVIYSPIQMACDLPSHYEGHPAFQFIRDVGVDWEQSLVLNGEVGDFVTIAREERDTGNWFVGSITDENPREITIDFSFLEAGVAYEAALYRDGEDAHWNDNPTSYQIDSETITSEDQRIFTLAPGGGFAISLLKP